MKLEVAEAVGTPAAADGEGQFLESRVGRQEPLQGSGDHTVLPPDIEKARNRDSNKKQKQGT
jgi:hypothetical protein